MKTRIWQLGIFLLLSVVFLLSACAPESGGKIVTIAPAGETGVEPAAGEATFTTAPQAPQPPADTETTGETTADRGVTALIMTLLSQRSMTEHSPRPDDFVPPDNIAAPPEDSWRVLEPAQSTIFQSYDGVRVSGEGEAWLDLGDLMHLILKRDTVAQFVPGEDAQSRLSNLDVAIPNGTPLLQRIVLGLHLTRGGFLGEKLKDEDVIALTTPNAVVLVSGTGFFIAYDPDANRTFAGNFDGTIDVTDGAMQEGDTLPAKQLIAIPPVRERKFWPIHDHLTFQEFERLIDVLESPIAAADMISGPYVVVERDPNLEVRSGPGSTFPPIGTMADGDYARIISEVDGWWQIECPAHLAGLGSDCWVAWDDAGDYNAEVVPPAPPTAVSAAMCRVSVPSIGFWHGPSGMRGDGGLIYNRIGYLNEGVELKIVGDAYSGQWYKVELLSMDGVTQVINLSAGSKGYVYAPNCPIIVDGPIPPASGIPPTVTVTPSPTPTPTPTNTPTPTPTITPTPTNSPTWTVTPDPTPDLTLTYGYIG